MSKSYLILTHINFNFQVVIPPSGCELNFDGVLVSGTAIGKQRFPGAGKSTVPMPPPGPLFPTVSFFNRVKSLLQVSYRKHLNNKRLLVCYSDAEETSANNSTSDRQKLSDSPITCV